MRRPVLPMLLALITAGCSQELTKRSVREFVDEADRAFLSGHASDICDSRSENFQFTGTTFKLAAGRTVNTLAEAEAVESERHAAGDRVTGKVVTMNARDFCRMAVESREAFRRMSLVRTRIDITMSPDNKNATVRAHYVLKSPEYTYGDSPLSSQDRVEQQTATLQTETDEESVITLSPGGDLVFAATHAISKQFRVPKERDSRL